MASIRDRQHSASVFSSLFGTGINTGQATICIRHTLAGHNFGTQFRDRQGLASAGRFFKSPQLKTGQAKIKQMQVGNPVLSCWGNSGQARIHGTDRLKRYVAVLGNPGARSRCTNGAAQPGVGMLVLPVATSIRLVATFVDHIGGQASIGFTQA